MSPKIKLETFQTFQLSKHPKQGSNVTNFQTRAIQLLPSLCPLCSLRLFLLFS